MGKDPGILELFSIPSIERLKLFIPREYEQERTDWYLRSLKEKIKYLKLLKPLYLLKVDGYRGFCFR